MKVKRDFLRPSLGSTPKIPRAKRLWYLQPSGRNITVVQTTIVIIHIALEAVGGVTDPLIHDLRIFVAIAVPVVLVAPGNEHPGPAVPLTLVRSCVTPKRIMVALPRVAPAVQSSFKRSDA